MKTNCYFKAFIMLLFVGCLCVTTGQANNQDATGTWKWAISTSDGREMNFALDLVQKEQSLSGTYHSPRGSESSIEEGKIADGKISFVVKREREGRVFTASYSGVLQGDEIIGKVAIGGGDRQFDWKAVREPAPVDATGTWKWTSTRRDGQVRETQMTLEQDGAKLTGSIKRTQGDTAIENGEILGNQLKFKVTRETQRGSFAANYQGKITGDTIEGTVEMAFGERSVSRDWVANRAKVDLTGTWAWRMPRDSGETWESNLELKLDGNKVTGFFSREDGDWRLEIKNGELKGATLTFQTVFEREGNQITINNTAKVLGNEIKGQSSGVREGESWTREWSAIRK